MTEYTDQHARKGFLGTLIVTTIFLIVLFLVLLALLARAGNEEAVAETQPTVTVTETVESVVEAQVVPTACLAALDDAEDIIDASYEMTLLWIDHAEREAAAWNAAAEMDYVAIQEYTDWVTNVQVPENDALTERLLVNNYSANAELCRQS